jgi:nanoRNase/pAp phosphatase (c-di-AMP/oligoRNAs hydrolase)
MISLPNDYKTIKLIKFYKKHIIMGETTFFKDIKRSIDDIITNINADFLIISHRADADGLASGAVMNCLVDILKDFYGGLGDNEIIRIMNFTKEGDNSLETITQITTPGTYYIISDLGSLNGEEINLLNNNNKIEHALIIDHHDALNLNKELYNLNPKIYSIKEEMSASAIAGLYSLEVLKRIKKDATQWNISKERINSIEEKIDKLILIALGGNKADMQGSEGLTRKLYEFLLNKNKLDKISSPFFGYKSKPLKFVVAESAIPFNLKYKIPSKIEIEKTIGKKMSQEEYQTQKMFFVIDEKKRIGINLQYAQTKEKGYDLAIKYNLPIIFEKFTDDVKSHDMRVKKASIFFSNEGIDTSKPIADFKKREETIRKIKNLYKENLEAFSDPQKLNQFLKMLYEENYCAVDCDYITIRSWSPSEQGNFMTALSKMGEGDLFIKGLKIELGMYKKDNQRDELIFNKITKTDEKYKALIKNNMVIVERLINENKMEIIKEGVYHLSLNELDLNETEGKTHTGVLGLLIVNSRMLPEDYGLLFTSLKLKEGKTKISSRINPFPKQRVYLGKFYDELTKKKICYTGGGHNEAASGELFNENLELFFDYVKKENFGR